MRIARPREYALVLLAAVASGCLPGQAPLGPDVAARERPGAVLVLRGSAFQVEGAREEASRLVGQVTARTVQEIAEEPSVDRVAKAAAARFDGTIAQAARADARDASCRKRARSIATAVAERAEVIVRVVLDAHTTTRTASDAERTELGRKPGLAGMLPGVRGDTVYETIFEGSLERTTFPGSVATASQKVRWIDRRLGTETEVPSPRIRAALAPAFAALPAPAPARWDAIARALVTGGCPVLGDAVAETFLGDEAAKRRIHAAALGVLQSASARNDEPSAMSMEPSPKPVQPSPTCEPTGEVVAGT